MFTIGQFEIRYLVYVPFFVLCSGDSGGGMVFKNELTKRYFIQGIASNVDRRPLQELKYCQNYNTFARVSSFVDWVQAQLDDFFLEEAEEEDEGVS